MAISASEIDLSNQVALVTGGGRGIGRATALALSAAGASVIVAARTQAQIEETAAQINQTGGTASAFTVDTADPASVETMFQEVEREYGYVDILVNNAGIVSALGPIWETDPQEWRKVNDINLYGCYLCARAALKLMIPRRRGRIINIGSGAALGAIANGSAYCVSKAALARLNECIAVDCKDFGICAFVIDPGNVQTDMADYLNNSDEARKYAPWYHAMVEAGEFPYLPVEAPAKLITLLASGKADALTGRFLSVWEDLTPLIQQAEQIQQADMYMLRLQELPKT